MKYNCVPCKMRGMDKPAYTLTKYNGYEISVCQECANALHPENAILRTMIRSCLDSILQDELIKTYFCKDCWTGGEVDA